MYEKIQESCEEGKSKSCSNEEGEEEGRNKKKERKKEIGIFMSGEGQPSGPRGKTRLERHRTEQLGESGINQQKRTTFLREEFYGAHLFYCFEYTRTYVHTHTPSGVQNSLKEMAPSDDVHASTHVCIAVV